MPLLEVDVSKKQMSRLRNGHSVRVKQGKGVCLIVDPSKFNTTTRAFGKRKGAQIRLDPQEILANYKKLDLPNNEPVEMEGKGLFDDLKKVAKKTAKKKVREGINVLKDNAAEIAGTTLGSAAAAGATSVGAPALAPVAGAIGYNVGKRIGAAAANKAEDKLREQTRRMRQPKNRAPAKSKPKPIQLDDQVNLDNTLRGVNKELGTNFGYLGSSGLGSLEANLSSAARIAEQVNDMRAENDGYNKGFETESFGGNGLYAGSGLYANVGRGLYASAQKDIRGKGTCDMKGSGNNVATRHMKSQAEDANFHFRFNLPPKYQQK